MTSECARDNWQTQVTRLFFVFVFHQRMPKAGVILSVVKERGWARNRIGAFLSDAEACVGLG